MMKPVIELIRVSTEQQAGSDRASIPAQRTVNRRTAAAYGLEIIKSIEITDVSGALILLAPEMQELIRLMADPSIHGVVAREFSRLMRPENYSDYALLQQFSDTNTVLYLPEGPIDFASKTGRLLGTIRAAIAGMERQEILERIWTAKEEKRRDGKFSQSKICLPYGVDYTDAQGWSYKPEAERVKRAFAMLLSGETGYGIIGRCVGLKAPTVRSILRNPIYTGWRVVDKRRDLSPAGRMTKKDGRQGDRRKVMRAEADVIRVKVIQEPLISEAEFAAAQAIIDTKKTRHWRTREDFSYRYTYNGFLTCALCNEPIYTRLSRADYYVCRNRHNKKGCQTRIMRRDVLESGLDYVIGRQFTDRKFLRSVAAEFQRKATGKTDGGTIDRAQAEILRLDSKRQRIMEAFFDGALSKAERDAEIAKVQADSSTAKSILFASRPAPKLDAKALAAVLSPFFEWKFLSRDDKRRLLTRLMPEIKVADYQLFGVTLAGRFSNDVIHSRVDTLIAENIYLPISANLSEVRV